MSIRSFAFAALTALPLVSAFAAEPSHDAGTMRLGADKIVALSDGVFQLPTDTLLIEDRPGVAKDLLAAAHLPTAPTTSVNAYLIDTGDRRILVDAGSGDLLGPSLGKVADSLAAAGYRPDQIDDVLITHLHPDHVGGVTRDGRAVFPHAVIHVAAQDAAFWLDKGNVGKVDASVAGAFDGAIAVLAPYQAAGRFKTFAPHEVIAPGLTAEPLAGHTPGHTVFRLESQGQVMVFWGDVVHVGAVQFADPDVTIHFDSAPEAARQARQSIFADAAARHYWVAASHLDFPGIGHVTRQGDHYAWIAEGTGPSAH